MHWTIVYLHNQYLFKGWWRQKQQLFYVSSAESIYCCINNKSSANITRKWNCIQHWLYYLYRIFYFDLILNALPMLPVHRQAAKAAKVSWIAGSEPKVDLQTIFITVNNLQNVCMPLSWKINKWCVTSCITVSLVSCLAIIHSYLFRLLSKQYNTICFYCLYCYRPSLNVVIVNQSQVVRRATSEC